MNMCNLLGQYKRRAKVAGRRELWQLQWFMYDWTGTYGLNFRRVESKSHTSWTNLTTLC